MKKSLIAAAIAAAVAAPAANAGVIVYGKIHASIDYYNPDDSSFHPCDDCNGGSDKAWYVTDRTSRIGFKGTEDLGNGLSLIWKAETAYYIDTGGWGGGRNAYIGLTGDWGTFLYGRHDTPYKSATQRLNVFADTMADNNSTVGFRDVRASNAIAYVSPNMNGFTVAGAIVPGENDADGANGLADGWSVAAMYSMNGLYLAAGYENLEKLKDDDSDTKWRVGIGYTMNAFFVSAIYEDYNDGGSDHEKMWQINGTYSFGNNVVKAMYGQNKEGDTENSWAIGLDHKLSKRTKAYVLYADSERYLHQNVDGAASGFSMGMMHTF